MNEQGYDAPECTSTNIQEKKSQEKLNRLMQEPLAQGRFDK